MPIIRADETSTLVPKPTRSNQKRPRFQSNKLPLLNSKKTKKNNVYKVNNFCYRAKFSLLQP